MINNQSALEFLCITINFQSYIFNDLRNTQWLRWSECAGAQFDIKCAGAQFDSK